MTFYTTLEQVQNDRVLDSIKYMNLLGFVVVNLYI